jgi:hypothetical protein
MRFDSHKNLFKTEVTNVSYQPWFELYRTYCIAVLGCVG